MENESPDNRAIVAAESNRQLSLPSEIVDRGLHLAARIEFQRGIEKYQKPIRYFPGIHAPSCIDFSGNGRFAAVTSYGGFCGEDPDLVVWDAVDGNTTVLSSRERGCHFRNTCYSVALSHSGDFVLAGLDDGGILCWHVKDTILCDFRGKTCNTYRVAAICMVFSPDDQWFFTNIGYAARMHDSGSGDFVRGFDPGHSDASYYNQMVCSNDGSRLLIGSGQFNDFMKLLDIRGEHEPVYFKSAVHIRAVSLFPDQQKLASLDRDGLITIWNAASGDEISHWTHGSPFSRVGDTCPEDQLRFLTFDSENPNRNKMILYCPFRSVATSPDGQRVLTGGGDEYMRLWSLDGKEICEYSHDTQVVKVAFLPDGQCALSGCWDGSVYLWALPS